MSFSTRLHASGYSQTHNNPAAKGAKIEIRRRVFQAIKAEGQGVRVFDAYAGKGELHRAVWHEADAYTGCDLEPVDPGDERLMFCAPNERVLRCIDLSPFNIIDLDAFGSPYTQAIIVASRRIVRKGEAFGLVITDGTGFKLKMHSAPGDLLHLIGMRGGVPAGVMRMQSEIIDLAVYAISRRMGCEVEKQWRTELTQGSQMKYVGLVLRGV